MIIYFSGTGNTRHCAEALAQKLGETTFEIKGGMLLAPSLSTLTSNDRRILWMFPVYSWGIPPVVESFTRRTGLEFAKDAVHHLVLTCGDDIGQTDCQWRKIMTERSLRTGKAFSVIMPNTYVLMKGFDVDSPEVENAKIEAASKRIDEIAAQLAEPSEAVDFSDVTRGRFAGIKSRVIYPWFVRHAMSPKPFHPTDQCTGCGLCVRSCPLGNITITGNSRPHWSNACALCLRCYHICPVHAVAYGDKTADKGQYRRFLK